MAKYIYTGQEVPHLFATDKQAYASNSNRSLRAELGKLYSYAEPIAAWFGDKVLLSADSFSVTTSKHQAWTRHAVNHIETIRLPRLKSILGNTTHSADDAARYVAARVKEIKALQESAKRLRSEWKKADNTRQILDLEAACAFVWNEWVGQKTPWQSAIAANEKAELIKAKARYAQARAQLESGMEYAARKIANCRESMLIDQVQSRNHVCRPWYRLDSCVADIRGIDGMGANRGLGIGSTATFDHAAKIMGNKWAKECTALAVAIHAYADSFMPELAALRADYDKQEAVKHAENIAAWLAGGDVAYPHDLPVACRVVGQEVQTSKGARVPLQGALQLVALAKQCRESGKGLDLAGHAIGPYRGNSISATGDLTIGCHNITWEAIADAVARHEGERE